MKRKFNSIKKFKEEKLFNLLEKKKNWKSMSSTERHELHHEIINLESDIKHLNLYKEIKSKFQL